MPPTWMKRGRGRLPSPAPPAAPPAGERAPYRSKQDERSFQGEVVETLDSKYPAVLYNASPNGVWYGRDRALAAIIARAVKKERAEVERAVVNAVVNEREREHAYKRC